MEPLYVQEFEINDMSVDRFGRLKPGMILFFAQEIAGRHCNELSVDYDTLAEKGLFWAVSRHRVQVTRLPMRGEKLRIETWPMPTTRVAYPRSMVAYDQEGRECFRSISIWVLMSIQSRAMILPGKSGISVVGTLRGNELSAPTGLVQKDLIRTQQRPVRFSDLDRNGHMNNTRCMDWIDDLLPSPFHEAHSVKEFTVCYFNEAREGQQLDIKWDFLEEGILQVDAHRQTEDKDDRIFSARVLFG